ncbi:MAG TPA: cyclase family protein [Terriglobia bacterium]|nr:cyclase family protein [Terriglobia bacterium]
MSMSNHDLRRMVDLSHVIEQRMATYKGLPGPVISEFLNREDSCKIYGEGTTFHIGKIEMVANTGTYVDSPFHRYAQGEDLAELPLTSLANLEGILIHATQRPQRAISAPFCANLDVIGKAVLFRTGWDVHWRSEQYFEGHPFLTRDAAQLLADSGAALVGIDSFNIDDTANLSRPVHSILLAAGIPIVEHLCNLQALPARDFRFFAVPPRIKQLGSFPVRAFAIIE